MSLTRLSKKARSCYCLSHMNDLGIKTAHAYPAFEETNRYAIEIAVNNYDDIFNEWDRAPFERRGLDPELQCFLEECSRDIALAHPLAIVFYMPTSEHDTKKETLCAAGIRNQFALKIHVLNKELHGVMIGVLRNFLIGISFLFISFLYAETLNTTLSLQVLGAGLSIGGWVFIWEALATIGFKNRLLHHTIKEWGRFLDAPIVFKKEPLPEQS